MITIEQQKAKDAFVRRCYRDRAYAHRVLFAHRHKDPATAAHAEMVRDWHNPLIKQALFEAFRGFGKSTLAEEALVLGAGLREFKNCLIVGVNAERAAERLLSVKNEFVTNEDFIEIYGDLQGPVWGVDRIILNTEIMIQSLGRGQALRGLKYLEQRPDFVLLDDIEGKQDTRTPEARKATLDWVMTELLPACDPNATVRMVATPLHEESLPSVLKKAQAGGKMAWHSRVYPIEYRDEEGARKPLWPERFPQEEIDKLRQQYASIGMAREFDMEYMCSAYSQESKPFKREDIKVFPRVKTWQACYAMLDPARTVKATSATTGFACWSWMSATKLVVWDAWGKFLLPDQMIEELFQANDRYSPVTIGVEEDGLNEWLMQPIRSEQVTRGVSLPVKAMKAPKGKLDFIRGLQPYFVAGEAEFAKDLPELKAQLLSFPTGVIDAPNALAYALKMRPGQPMYDGFNSNHIGEGLLTAGGQTTWLCINAVGGMVIGVVAQLINGAVRVFYDYVREGEPADVLHDIVKAACIDTGRQVRLCVPPGHFDKYHNVGLVQAARRIPMEVRRGLQPVEGRHQLRTLLGKEIRGASAVKISDGARWTLNGFAGGYARQLDKTGVLKDEAEDNQYKLVLEALESFCGFLKIGSPDEEEGDVNYAYTADGKRYVSAWRGGRN